MITENKLDRTFGPFGSSAGYFLMVGGLGTLWVSAFGAIIIVVGAFMALTTVSARIDFEGKRVKLCDNLFGIIPAGRWIPVMEGMRLGIKNVKRGYRAYSVSGRSNVIQYRDVRVVLVIPGRKGWVPLKNCRSAEEAREEARLIGNGLGILSIDW